MNEFIKQPWIRVLVVASTVAMCSLAVRETASITLPVVTALKEVLIPVAIGFTIAYMLTPVAGFMHRRLRLPTPAAAGILFGTFSAVAIIVASLVIPTVVRQSTALASRLFEGEHFIDVNHNGHWDEGEPFDDDNGNGRYDARGMLASALAWAEESQGRMRQFVKLELDQPALSFLSVYLDETVSERALIDAALICAQEARPPEQWPEALRRDPPADAPLSWNPAWPGVPRALVDDAYGKLPPELRDRWMHNLAVAGQSLASKQSNLLAAWTAFRHHADTASNPDLTARTERIQAAINRPTNPDLGKAASAFAARLIEQEKLDQPAAKELLTDLRDDDSHAGSQWLRPVVDSLGTAVRTQMDALPQRIGGWVSSGFASITDVIAFALDVLLVPIYAFFLILAMPAVRHGVRDNLPTWNRDQVLRIFRDIERVVAAFFRGRLIVCLICGVLCYVGFLAVSIFSNGVPYAALFALLIGLATAVPFAGFLFLVPAVVLTLLDGGTGVTAGLVIGVYTVVQIAETVVLTPMIMGREVELHPVTLIVALLLFGKLFGILGVIMAVPIAATCRILAREYLWPWVRRLAIGPQAPAMTVMSTPPPPP